MNPPVPELVGTVVAITAQRLLAQRTSGARPALRVTGFRHDEVIAAVRHLSTPSGSLDEGSVIKVGTRTPVEGLPDGVLLRDGETLTFWRNQPVSAILLFDWDVQSDQEGLAAITRLDDVSLLNSSDPDDIHDVFGTVAETAWSATGNPGDPPARLQTALGEVRDAIRPTDRLSLRRWSAYVLRTCELANAAELRTPDEIGRAAGRSLSELGLFPDSALFADGNAARSRLTKNLNVSEFKQPSGSPILDDDLAERIEAVEPPQDVLDHLGLSSHAAKNLMRQVLPGGDVARAEIELQLWLLLFDRSSPDRKGLGALVREDLEQKGADRIPEFDDLEVEPGLNDSDQAAAERLVRAEPLDGSPSLVDLISGKLRRRVQKVAFPDAQLAPDPLRALLHEIHVLDDGEEHTVQLKLDGIVDSSPWSRWLFSYLYGRTLRRIEELTEDERLGLNIDEKLLKPERPESDDAEEDFDVTEAWGPLRLAVVMEGAGVRRFRWEPLGTPGLLGFGALLSGLELEPGERFDGDFEEFFERFQLPRDWTTASTDPRPLGPISSRIAALRQQHVSKWREGIDADLLDEYVTAWEPLINEARASLIPANSPDQDLADVVLTDIAQLAGDRLVMLGTHPLRLRWLGRHLRQMTDLLVGALTNGLKLNEENTELFFEWIQRISPHGTPPLVVGEDETVAIAVRESAFHEEYTPVRGRAAYGRDWLAMVDDAAVDELVKVAASYVETYPHKRDGLALLLLDREGAAQLSVRLVRRLRARVPAVRVELVILTDRSNHYDIVQAFDREFGDEELAEERMFPDVQLVLQHWTPDSDAHLADLEDRIDLALAPALFGTRTTVNPKTRDASAGIAGGYNPLLHRSSHDLHESRQNVVRAMLPAQRDPLLETWSTLCVRHDIHSAVAPLQESNTDYFEMQVRFDQHQRLFVGLHRVAHWVVTLDAFIGRDQIDALEDKPDVILVRPGIGKNEAYTLIVSSGTGRRFVANRLSHKLVEMQISDTDAANQVAQRLYDVGRNVVPGAVLRALGLGSAANEIVGVVTSRFAVDRLIPSTSDRSRLVVWLSFDELHDWFGRVQRTRADLGRFVFTLDEDGTVRLDILVVESKFRQSFDLGTAEQQLDRTIALCEAAFGSGDVPPHDRDFWLQELASAIERTSSLRLAPSELPARSIEELGSQSVETAVMSAIQSGDLTLGEVKGVAVAIAAANDDHAPPMSSLGQHYLLRLNRPDLLQTIASIVRAENPSTGEGEATEPTAEVVHRETERAIRTADIAERSSATERPEPVRGPETVAPTAPSTSEGGLGSDELRNRYERLLDVLDQHNVSVVPATRDPWIEGPGFYVLRVAPRTGVTVDRVVNRVNEIALALQLPAGLQIRTSLDRGNIVFEVPKSQDERYPVSAPDMWERSPIDLGRLVVPIGVDIAGQTVSIEFSSPDSPHLLVAGTTGSGKSVALETVLRGLCRYPEDAVHLRLVDPKGTELLDFEEDPHVVSSIGVYAQDAIEILEAAVVEMETRYQLMRPVRARSIVELNSAVGPDEKRPWTVIVLDEYADLTSDPADKAAIEALLKRLAAKARAAGIHIIAATQRPSADVISTTIRSNLPAQLALRVKTATDSRIIMDESGAEALAGQGDAFLRTARGVQRLQVAWVG